MKTISADQMLQISGGSKFWTAACGVWVTLSIFKVFTYTTPVTAALATAADITCALVAAHDATEIIIDIVSN